MKSCHASNQPRARNGRFIKYRPDSLPLSDDLSTLIENVSRSDKPVLEQPQPYLPGEPYSRLLRGRIQTFRSHFSPFVGLSVESSVPFEQLVWKGPMTDMWKEAPWLWQACGDLQDTETEWTDLVSSVIAELASCGDVDPYNRELYMEEQSDMQDSEAVVMGAKYAGHMLGWPPHHFAFSSVFFHIDRGASTEPQDVGEVWYRVLRLQAKWFPGEKHHNISSTESRCRNMRRQIIFARSAQFVIQKVLERLGTVPNVHPLTPFYTTEGALRRLVDCGLSSSLRLHLYGEPFGHDGDALLRYCANSESPFTAHIFEPNPYAALTWKQNVPEGDGRTLHAFKIDGEKHEAYRDIELEEQSNVCNWAEFALGRKTPTLSFQGNPMHGFSFESMRVPLALYVITRCEQGDPLREKAENFVTEMGFQPIAHRHVLSMLSQPSAENNDHYEGLRLAESYRQYWNNSVADDKLRHSPNADLLGKIFSSLDEVKEIAESR